MRIKIIAILIILTAISFGQNIKKKWVLIKDNNEISLFIDEGNIKELDNQISIWSLKIYKNPSKFTQKGILIGKEKAQFLINKLNEKYSLIGKIRYDDVGRIIREIDTEGKIEQEDVKDNEEVSLLYNKAKQYLSSGRIVEVKPVPQKTEMDTVKQNEELAENSDKEVPRAKPVLNLGNKNIKNSNEPDIKEEKTEKKKEDDFLIFVGKKKITTEIKKTFDESGIETTEVAPAKPVIETKKRSEPEKVTNNNSLYDVENDKLVSGRIFSDGIFYSVQVSAWRSKAKAQKEVRKYKNKGYNAFMIRAEIPGKGIWYRVRVGVYKSLDEAKSALRKL